MMSCWQGWSPRVWEKCCGFLTLATGLSSVLSCRTNPTQADSLQLEPTTPDCLLFLPAAGRSAGPEVGMGAWQGDAQQESTRLLKARATLVAVPSANKTWAVHGRMVGRRRGALIVHQS